MTYKEFLSELSEWGLTITDYQDGRWSVGYRKIANPMLYFTYTTAPEDYNGSVSVKAINVPIFTADELKATLNLVHELLMTPINERGEIKLF